MPRGNIYLIIISGLITILLSACGGSGKPYIQRPEVDSVQIDTADGSVGDLAVQDLVEDTEMVEDSLPDSVPDTQPDTLLEVIEDTGEDTLPDTIEDIPEDTIPPEITADFCLVVHSGECRGLGLDALSLLNNGVTMDDLYPETPELEVDVLVMTSGAPAGTPIELLLDGNPIGSMLLSGDSVQFSKVHFSHQVMPNCHIVSVRADGEEKASKVVCADTGSCGVTMSPSNDLCLSQDSNPLLPGFQAVFTVTNGGSDCTSAWIQTLFGTSPAVVLENGSADIEVTLSSLESGISCQYNNVSAYVGDPGNPSRNERLELQYRLDTEPTMVSIEDPVSGILNLADDLDGEPENGLQIDVFGQTSGLGPQDPVILSVDGEDVGTTTSQDGTFLFTSVTLASQGHHVISVRTDDFCCSQESSAAIEVTVLLIPSNIVILSPVTGESLLAKDDGNPATPKTYDSSFQVTAPVADAGTVLRVKCRSIKAGSIQSQVGQLTISEPSLDANYSIPVQMNVDLVGNQTKCQVSDNLVPQNTSPEVVFDIGLPAPKAQIIRPLPNEILDPTFFDLICATENLQDLPVTLEFISEEELVFTEEVISGEIGFTYSNDISQLDEGFYRIRLSGTDLWGNLLEDNPQSVTTVDVEFDKLPPTLQFLAPLPDSTCDLDVCPDVSEQPGYQIPTSIQVSGEAHPELTKVCVRVNSAAPICGFATEEGGLVNFDDVIVQPGLNTLWAEATDAVEHVSDEVSFELNVTYDSPRVIFVTPAGNAIFAEEPVPVLVRVTSADEATPLGDAEVHLLLNGVDVGVGTPEDDGLFSFSLTGVLPDVKNSIQAMAVHTAYSLTGYSALRYVTIKSEAPSITLTQPLEDAVFNLASPECAEGLTSCMLDITAETANVEDGGVAALLISCNSQPVATSPCSVHDNICVWTDVVLPNKSMCTITASVQDLAGQLSSSAPISVKVDRTPPKILKFVQPGVEMMPAVLDQNKEEPGYQLAPIVRISGLETGTVLHLEITDTDANATLLEQEILTPVTDQQNVEINFPTVTFEEGIYLLRAYTEDAAGNAVEKVMVVHFFMTEVQVGITSSDFVNFTTCSNDSECGNQGICQPISGQGFCMTPWKRGPHKLDAFTQPLEMFAGSSNIRICSDHPQLIGHSLCSNQSGSSPFYVVKQYDHPGGPQVLQLTEAEVLALPQGHHNMFIEALRVDLDTWVPSLSNTNYLKQERNIWLDTKAPSVQSLTFLDDTISPVGILNIDEQVGQGVFRAEIALSEVIYGSAEVWINGNPDQDVDVVGTASLELNLALNEGLNQITIYARDHVGNTSVPFQISIQVDTFAPILNFIQPNTSPLLAGSSSDAIVSATGTDANPVIVERMINGSWIEAGTQIAGPQGKATFLGLLAQNGEYQLRARVSDDAANQTIASTLPAIVIVDRTAPVIDLLAPQDGVVLGDGDDASLEDLGFQIMVDFDLSAADSWTIKSAECSDPQFTTCGNAYLIKAGTVEGEAAVHISELWTVQGINQMEEYRKLTITASDATGNQTSVTAQVMMSFENCWVNFTNAPESGWFNTAYCETPGSDCESITTVLTAAFSAACGNVDQIALYKDGVLVETSELTSGNKADFSILLTHGDQVELEARLLFGGAETSLTTGVQSFGVDLTNPVVLFDQPLGTELLLGIADDLSAGIDGCQLPMALNVTGDNLLEGRLIVQTRIDGAVSQLDQLEITGEPFAKTWESISLPEAKNLIVEAIATDRAGNEGIASFSANVDVVAPGPIDLKTIHSEEDVNPRRPSVLLTWNAVGDNGSSGEPAAKYDIRYSKSPITGANFKEACQASDLMAQDQIPNPSQPGSFESFELAGPDPRDPQDPCAFIMSVDPDETFFFAVQAIDDVGNSSLVTATQTESTTGLGLDYTRISRGSFTDGNMERTPTRVGDVDGDGYSDFMFGTYTGHGFCITRGRPDPGAELDVSNDEFTQCITDSYNSKVGFDFAGIGDVNGDLLDDVAVVAYKEQSGADVTTVRVYLGRSNGLLDETPSVVFSFGTTVKYGFGWVMLGKAGNFNGDSVAGVELNDIIIGLPEANRVYVIPGNAAWTAGTQAIDLENSQDRNLYKVLTINLTGGTAGSMFGIAVGSAGDVILDTGSSRDDIVIGKYAGPSAGYVIRGRALTTGTTITLSSAFDGTGSDDANAVRLIPDPQQASQDWFCGEITGGMDLNSDGIPEVGCAHLMAALSGKKDLYLFDGAAINSAVGSTLQLDATQVIGTDINMGEAGVVIKGDYYNLKFLGDFDDSTGDSSGPDLVYGDFKGYASFGHVYVRLNIDSGEGIGSFQYRHLTITDPFEPGSLLFGGWRVADVGDFNGDGLPDLVVGTDGGGYMVLVH